MNILKKLLYPIAITATLSLSACSIFGVYKIDLPQGTPITQTQAQQIQPGMNKNQVLYLIGSPALRDTLAPNRWDYIYDYTPGTYGEREGKKVISNASQHLIIYFDESDTVVKVEGIESLPATKQ
ncbi:outer membrane protein assembly factor BamE [Psychrobacter sanguinis]|uniref:outer membrane protein assembly factor BamE n=1 Tax=Psychrobacter sanguinis TaxID=861445 RepID=UPI00020C7F08|nr:outer membrane protein assembly factor BamE [Psychrobacter sanguinis]EGK09483.1 outer membrane lipoprotein [Psychrobacter sp. 1501(2011)]MCC3307052.1 outer membrane protein assembly factor BamE [Psychrobacter sanguinis]MCD9152341.1 outer membrane protein assembly factor BamE [Psychrobacter sanguinis]MDY3306456.1 outer membrane protein assembly factor BamE [Psychrobacter sanguinis]UEC24426.1 outer membrane protein assembly factor BamE [Psychrobacter sanguinis]